jgi:hypothetical protein
MTATHVTSDVKLAAKIVDAMKEYDAADATRKEKAIAAGRLLNEAHKRHPGNKAFEKFLQLAGGIQSRRAQELIAIAVGRKEFEQQQAANAAAAQRHRDKLKAEKIERERAKAALPKPEPKPKGKAKPSALRHALPIEEDDSHADTAEDIATRGLFNRACEAYALAKWKIDEARMEKNLIDAVNDAADAWIDLRKRVLAAANTTKKKAA